MVFSVLSVLLSMSWQSLTGGTDILINCQDRMAVVFVSDKEIFPAAFKNENDCYPRTFNALQIIYFSLKAGAKLNFSKKIQ